MFSKEQFPCQALYFQDDDAGVYLMFERELTQTERYRVREMFLDENSHWLDTSTLVLTKMEA